MAQTRIALPGSSPDAAYLAVMHMLSGHPALMPNPWQHSLLASPQPHPAMPQPLDEEQLRRNRELWGSIPPAVQPGPGPGLMDSMWGPTS